MRLAVRVALMVLLAVLLMPTAMAQSTSGDAQISLVRGIDIESLRPEPHPEQTGLGCEDAAGLFTVAGGHRPAFSFHEGERQQCGAVAVFDIPVPRGTSTVEMVFGASKDVDGTVGIPGLTEFGIGVETQAFIQMPGQPRSYFTFFDDDEPTENAATPLRFQAAVPSDVRFLQLGWSFLDAGADNADPSGSTQGHAVNVDIIDPRIRFIDVPVAGAIRLVDHDVRRDAIEQHLRIEGLVPAGEIVDQLSFTVSNEWSIHEILIPDGRVLALDAFGSREDAGTLQLTVPQEVLAAYGPGVYTGVFAASTALEPTPALVPIILMLMVAPMVVGVYATRGIVVFAQQAVGRYRDTARNLRLSLYTIWALYAVTVAMVLFGRMWPLVVSWPVQVEAALVHGGFVGAIVGFILIGFQWRRQIDDTMRADLADKDRTNRELKRSNEELEQFAYVASHDLQEPLRTVARFTQLLEHRYGDQLDDDAREFIAYSVDGANRMQRLIDDLLAFSRIESRGRPLTSTHMDEVVGRVVTALAAAIEEKGAVVERDSLPVVLGDEGQLAQLMQNLISNALKFQPEGQQPHVHIGVTRDDGRWHFTVADNGIGMDKKFHDRVFIVFQRLHARDEYAGTGIGLAVCKKIVQRHGGDIWVESEPGKGTTIHFTLLDPGQAGAR